MDLASLIMSGLGLGMQGAGMFGVGSRSGGGVLGGPPQAPMPQNFSNMNKPSFMMPNPYKRSILGNNDNTQPANTGQFQYNPYSWWRR